MIDGNVLINGKNKDKLIEAPSKKFKKSDFKQILAQVTDVRDQVLKIKISKRSYIVD